MKKTAIVFGMISLTFISHSQQQDNMVPTTGNVGLGTLNPTARLQVNGNLKVDSCLVVEDSLIVNSGVHLLNDFKVEGPAYINGPLYFSSLSPQSPFTWNMDDVDLLLLNGDSVVKATKFVELLEIISTSIGTPPPAPAAPLGICDLVGMSTNPKWYSDTNVIYSLCPNVRVGVGTESPLKKLHIKGSGYFENSVFLGNSIYPSSPAYLQGYSVFNDAKPWMRFSVDDNGVDNTTFLVKNDGSLYCTSVRVRLKEDLPVPDFVFKSDYKLMPLSELKSYVQTNSHLPNIPSEKEIRDEGLSIEEMQMRLLQKVEELTLYVIELKEENEALKNDVERLKDK